MRTTLKIDDDVLESARVLARAHGKTVGQVLSELARKGLRPAQPKGTDRGFPVFEVREDTPMLTPEMVYRAYDDNE